MSKLEKTLQEPKEPRNHSEEDAKIEDFVRREYLREAEEIEAALSEGEPEEEVPPEVFDHILLRLKEKGITFEEEDAPEEKAVPKRRIFFLPRRRWLQWAAIFCITCLGIFGASMTSEANRAYMMEQVDLLLGNETGIKVNNDGDRVESNTDEEEAAAEIEKELKVEVPDFLYLPTGMSFDSSECDAALNVAQIGYVLNESVMTLYIATNEENAARMFGFDGDVIGQIENKYQGIIIEISSLQVEDQIGPRYVARWTYKNNYYILSAQIEQDEFENILEKMMY